MRKTSSASLPKRPRGRPPKTSTPLYCKIETEVAEMLDRLVVALDRPKTIVIEDAVRDFAKKHKVKLQVLDVPDATEEAG